MRQTLGACVAILSLAVVAIPASAQLAQPDPQQSVTPCGPRDSILEALERIGEVPVGVGVAGNEGKAVIELTVAPDGSWSVLVSDVDGKTCLVLAGQEWDFAKPQPVGDPT
ncbi:MAG TPA: hypothetical protein VHG92_08050 [Afifellaceae bacterium]|nr:hypothetical protein [Afifellaceae bacterium]